MALFSSPLADKYALSLPRSFSLSDIFNIRDNWVTGITYNIFINSGAGAAELCGFLDSKKIRWIQHSVSLFSFLLVVYNYPVSADKYFIRGYLSLWLFSAKILVGVWVYVLCIPFPCAYPISIFRQSFIGLFYIYLSACGSVWPFEINNADIVFGPDELWIWPIACHFSRISSVNIFFFASFLELIRRLYLGTVCM